MKKEATNEQRERERERECYLSTFLTAQGKVIAELAGLDEKLILTYIGYRSFNNQSQNYYY